MNIALTKKVSDLTVGEFRDLIRDTFSSVIDPDYGLELRPEFEEGLRESIEQKRHDEGYSLSQVKKRNRLLMLEIIILPKARDDLKKVDQKNRSKDNKENRMAFPPL